MGQRTGVLAVVLVAAAAVLAACGGSSEPAATTAGAATTEPAATTAETSGETTAESGETLQGTVGPGFTITLTYDGQPVTNLSAGTYTVEVDDQANIHNFHLTGPGVDETTDVSGTGKTTWTVNLQAGTYHFQCDPHASQMNGDFTVS